MSKCIKCGINFVGTPENPPQPGLCKWCEIKELKKQVESLQAERDALAKDNANLIEEVKALERELDMTEGFQ
jgi:hypothetical protein